MAELQWDDLRVFLALSRAGNLGEAAALLGVDRSTISRRIAQLEKGLGARLFARTRDGLRPTAAAERLRPHAAAVESEVQALRGAAAGSAPACGSVRVATTEGMAAFLVERGLLDLVDAHPELQVAILAGNRPLDVARGEADLALRLTPLHQPSLRVRCVCRFGVGLFASPRYLAARGRPRSRAALERALVLESIPARPIWLVASAAEAERPAVRLVGDRIAAIFSRAQALRA